jgi:lipopolysaccharide export system protein LptA
MTVSRALILFAALAAFAIPATAINAQPVQPQPVQPKVASAPPVSKGPPNALQGFSQNRDQPVKIEAATLEVRDKDKVATFSGDVKVQQGDTGLRCKSLMVFYEQDAKDGTPAANTMPAADAGPGGEQRIKRLEAKGSVVVTQKEQTATGELGVFDMKTNTVTLSGNVIMTQGKNILRGDRLIVDLTSGVSKVESSKNANGRVQMLLQPGSGGPIDMPGGGQSPFQSNRP